MKRPEAGSRIFISYARADGTEAARLLETRLERSGFDVWRDVRNIRADCDFSVEIVEIACDPKQADHLNRSQILSYTAVRRRLEQLQR